MYKMEWPQGEGNNYASGWSGGQLAKNNNIKSENNI